MIASRRRCIAPTPGLRPTDRTSCRTFGRRAGQVLAVLFVGIVAGGSVGAQAQNRTIDQLGKVLDPRQAAAQKKLVADLEAFARSTGAAPGSPDYWAVIRANLADGRHSVIEGGERSLPALTRRFRVPNPEERKALALDRKSREALELHLDRLRNGERIFGGAPAEPGEFPEVVSLARRGATATGLDSFCTGTLIAAELANSDRTPIATVITAAHCVCGPEFDVEPSAVVVFGADVNQPGAITAAYRITRVQTMQADYCNLYRDKATKSQAKRDVAFVQFDVSSQPIIGNTPKDGLPLARLATWQMLFGSALDELLLVGFGLTEKDYIGQKRYVVSSVAEPVCRPDSPFHCLEGTEIVVVDVQQKRDTCSGDSGGPAFIPVGQRTYLAAITSRGGDCGTGGIYSLVTPHILEWLTTEMSVDPIICDAPARCVRRVK